jgi:hypothetical protein
LLSQLTDPALPGRHNDGVTRRTRARWALTGALLVPALALSACGGSDKPASTTPTKTPQVSLPTGNVAVPSGVTMTPAGTQLAFGKTATVADQPNTQRNTVLELTVHRVVKGKIGDLSGYVLDDRTRASTPYYVTVSVVNVGDGDVGGTDIPLWAVPTGANAPLIHSSTFTNSFRRCPSRPLPKTFAPHAKLTTCQLYLLPNHGVFSEMSFRPLQAFEPIIWKGAVITPASPKKKKS